MTEEKVIEIRKALKPFIDQQRQEGYNADYRDKASDEEILGVILSNLFDYNINSLVEVAKSAFEDSNFHEGVAALDYLSI